MVKLPERDPVEQVEVLIRALHAQTAHATKPVRKRYPLLFALLLTFSVAAIFQGFEILVSETPWLREHPIFLMVAGLALLFITGGLYKVLQKP